MRGLVKVGLVSWAVLTLPVAAAAQDDMGRRASLFDLGIYAGGAYTTDWFDTPSNEGDDDGWGPGFAPVFGATATYWTSPYFGLHGRVTFMPSNFAPEGFSDDKVNIFFVDLGAVTGGRDSSLIRLPRNVHAYAGPSFIRASPDGGDASNGFGFHVGIGTSFSPLGPTLTPFVDATLRGYPAPFDNANDKFAVGGDLVFGLNIYLR